MLDQMNLLDIYTTFHTKATEYTLFSSAHGLFIRWIIYKGTKQVSTFRNTEIISDISSAHDAMKLEANYKKKIEKNHKRGD